MSEVTHTRSPVASDLLKAHFSLGRDPTGSCLLSLIAFAGLENQYKSFSIRHACRVCAPPAVFSRRVRGLAGAAPLLTLTSPHLGSVAFAFCGRRKKIVKYLLRWVNTQWRLSLSATQERSRLFSPPGPPQNTPAASAQTTVREKLLSADFNMRCDFAITAAVKVGGLCVIVPHLLQEAQLHCWKVFHWICGRTDGRIGCLSAITQTWKQ